ncbi:MAG: hypothetical protein CV045_02965 [Cyanobacteria bacterium M5B4]|nr:MAG: hypothetical protein CV045_02965 [Cyanobacteria bacterium M5B4]
MSKGKLNPSFVELESVPYLDTTNFLECIPITSRRQWFSFTKENLNVSNQINYISIAEGQGVFIPLPKNAPTAQNVTTTVSITTDNVVIQGNSNKSIFFLDLNRNITLSLENIPKYKPIYLVIKFNDFKVVNLFNLGRWDIKPEVFLLNFAPLMIIEVLKIDVINLRTIYYDDLRFFKNRKTILQINPRNDTSYYEDVFSSNDYPLGTNTVNESSFYNLTTPLVIPFKDSFNLSSPTKFHLYIDFSISNFSDDFVNLIDVSTTSTIVWRLKINRNTIVYQFGNRAFTYNFNSSFVDGERYLIEFVRDDGQTQQTALSIKICPSSGSAFLTPSNQTFSQVIDHIPYSNIPLTINCSKLYGFLLTTDNQLTARIETPSNYSSLENLFYYSSLKRRDFIQNPNKIFTALLETNINETQSSLVATPSTSNRTFSNGFVSLNGDSISYAPTSSFDLNQSDFTISFFCQFTSPSNKGVVISRWNPGNNTFIILFTETFIIVRFRTSSKFISLDTDITNLRNNNLNKPIFFEFVRTGNSYLLFAGGALINYSLTSDNTAFNSTAPITIGHPEIFDSNLPSSAISFEGKLSHVQISKSSQNITNHIVLPPQDVQPRGILSYKFYYTTRELSQNRAYTLKSNNFTLTRKTPSGKNVLSGVSHFETVINNLDFSDQPLTLEAYIYNSENTYASIINIPDVLTFGIKNEKLNITLYELSLSFDSVAKVPINSRVHLSYVRDGNNHLLFINGNLESTNTGTGKINASPISNAKICVKRNENNNTSDATVNTNAGNYPGLNTLEIDSIAIYPFAKYTNSFTPPIEI